MSMSGESIVLLTHEQEVLAELDFVPESGPTAVSEIPEATLALGGLGANTAVLSRTRQEAAEDVQLQVAGEPPVASATTFQSAF